MARTTAHPNHRCISSEDVQGTEVYGAEGKNIGEIDHLIIDKMSGRVAYAVIGQLPPWPLPGSQEAQNRSSAT